MLNHLKTTPSDGVALDILISANSKYLGGGFSCWGKQQGMKYIEMHETWIYPFKSELKTLSDAIQVSSFLQHIGCPKSPLLLAEVTPTNCGGQKTHDLRLALSMFYIRSQINPHKIARSEWKVLTSHVSIMFQNPWPGTFLFQATKKKLPPKSQRLHSIPWKKLFIKIPSKFPEIMNNPRSYPIKHG